jgi:hypothetical protein
MGFQYPEDQDFRVNIVFSPGPESIAMEPRWRRTTWREKLSPIPEPSTVIITKYR